MLDVPVREVRGCAEQSKHKRYDEETKREAVRLYSKGMRAADVARRLNLSSGELVAHWARLADAPPQCATMPARRSMPVDADERAEMERLREEFERSRMRERVLLELMRDPKAGGPGETLQQAEDRIGREAAEGLRVLPEAGGDLLRHAEEYVRLRLEGDIEGYR